MRIAHVITGLGAGGTPVMLHKVLSAQLAMPEIESCVVGLIHEGAIGQKIRELGIPVTSLGMKPTVPDPRGLWKLTRTLRAFRPDLIQSWLYHADLMSSLASPWITGHPPVVWNLRHATLDPRHDSLSTRLAARACAWISRRSPARILVNTVSGRRVHTDYGYADEKLQVVPNGFDLQRFHPDAAAKRQLKESLGLADNTPLIGLVARFSELKGQQLFIGAMTQVAAALPSVHFVLCGTQITPENAKLTRWIQESGCAQRFHLLGERLDIERVHAALDAEVSASVSEAFSNSIGEALCCGVPCVVTDVGDSAWLIDDAGCTVPPCDKAAMAKACIQLLTASPQSREALSIRARQRMEQQFDIHVIARQYRDIWTEVLLSRNKSPSAGDTGASSPDGTHHPDRHAA